MSNKRGKKKKRKVVKSAKDKRAERIVYLVIVFISLMAILIAYKVSKDDGGIKIYENKDLIKTEKEK